VGTEGFIPPEGPGTPQADLYSLGKVLYEISTGLDRREFLALPEDFAQQQSVDQPRANPKSEIINPESEVAFLELNAVIVKACQADPARRYPTTGKALSSTSTGCGPSGRRKTSSRPSGCGRWAAPTRPGSTTNGSSCLNSGNSEFNAAPTISIFRVASRYLTSLSCFVRRLVMRRGYAEYLLNEPAVR
jgi:serine/threonine protein kinase